MGFRDIWAFDLALLANLCHRKVISNQYVRRVERGRRVTIGHINKVDKDIFNFLHCHVLDPTRRLHTMTLIEDIINGWIPYELSVSPYMSRWICKTLPRPLIYVFIAYFNWRQRTLIDRKLKIQHCRIWLTRLAKVS